MRAPNAPQPGLEEGRQRRQKDDIYFSPTPYRTPRTLEKDEKNQMHVQGQCATYIFIAKGQVACLHFDGKRRQCFYQGHRLEASNCTPAMVNYLMEFKSKLASDYPDAEALLNTFTEVLQTLGPVIPQESGRV